MLPVLSTKDTVLANLVHTTMTVTGGVSVCLLVMVTLSLALDATTSPLSLQESETQHSRRLQRLEAEMEVLHKFITEVKKDCKSGLEGSPQTPILSRVAGEISELRAQLQETEMRKELSDLRERLFTLQSNVQAVQLNMERKESGCSPQSKVAFLGQLPGWKFNVPSQSPIHFTKVFDIGDGFNSLTGVYTVKCSGIYLINFQMFPDFPGNLHIDLKINGNILVRTRVTDFSPYTASSASGLSVRAMAGDRFWLESLNAGVYYGSHHSFLSLALIAQV